MKEGGKPLISILMAAVHFPERVFWVLTEFEKRI